MLRPFFIDTDTASDDAVALVIALTHPDVEVVGISVVAGNVPLDLGVQNALWVAEQCNASVPVHAGAAAPLVVPLETGQYVHGADGMGDIGLPLTGRTPASKDGVSALLDASHRYAGQLELVTLGPLTNLALALRADPALPERLARCVVMGAVADHVGNQTPVAEFNMWVDPHSVDEVLRSAAVTTSAFGGCPVKPSRSITTIPRVSSLDVSHQHARRLVSVAIVGSMA